MSGKSVIASFVAGVAFCAVFFVGDDGDTRVETRVVKVPVIKTRTIDKEVRVTLPLPDSCKRLADLYTAAGENEDAISSAAGKIEAALDNLTRDAQGRDIKGLNDAMQVILEQRRLLTTSQNARSASLANTDYMTDKCNTDIKEAE
jgi:hypothetical protein